MSLTHLKKGRIEHLFEIHFQYTHPSGTILLIVLLGCTYTKGTLVFSFVMSSFLLCMSFACIVTSVLYEFSVFRFCMRFE